MSFGQPIPERQSGRVLASIEFRTWPNQSVLNTNRVAEFRHWDQRIWQASIVAVPAGSSRPFLPEAGYMLSLTSSGCRTYQFLSPSVRSCERTCLRFANMHLERYRVLVCDAQGTEAHPRGGFIGIVTVHYLVESRDSVLGRPTGQQHIQEVRRLGRFDYPNVVVFPSAEELETVLEDACDSGCAPLVPANVNTLPAVMHGHTTAFSMQRLEGTNAAGVEEAQLAAAVNSHFNDTTNDVLAGLSSGAYRTPALRPREQRAIELE